MRGGRIGTGPETSLLEKPAPIPRGTAVVALAAAVDSEEDREDAKGMRPGGEVPSQQRRDDQEANPDQVAVAHEIATDSKEHENLQRTGAAPRTILSYLLYIIHLNINFVNNFLLTLFRSQIGLFF